MSEQGLVDQKVIKAWVNEVVAQNKKSLKSPDLDYIVEAASRGDVPVFADIAGGDKIDYGAALSLGTDVALFIAALLKLYGEYRKLIEEKPDEAREKINDKLPKGHRVDMQNAARIFELISKYMKR